ncbi:hypothetical protein R1flu_020502 [Riccia fluitans]|uniref:Uncharacterized protein n=1 Tax=Riccia fluitans TaxID=41844 RepID=A0ABD1ZQ70_9MARC
MDWLLLKEGLRYSGASKFFSFLFTQLLLLNNFERAAAAVAPLEAANGIAYQNEHVSRVLSSSRRWSDLSAGRGSAPTVSVSGRILCTSCVSVSTPLMDVEVSLLCPHPPPGGGGELSGKEEKMLLVSSALTSKSGFFQLTVNASYAQVMKRCAVIISKSSFSNCDIPPPNPPGLLVPISSTSGSDSGASSEPHVVQLYSLGSISFRPAESCSVHAIKAAAAAPALGKRRPRTLLQNGEDPLRLEQGTEKQDHHQWGNNNKDNKRTAVLASDDNEAAVVMGMGHHDRHQLLQSRILLSHHHHRHHHDKIKESSSVPSSPEKPLQNGLHAPGTPSFVVKSLMTPHSHQPTVTTEGHHHSHGGGPPNVSTDRRRRSRGGPSGADYSHDSEANNNCP